MRGAAAPLSRFTIPATSASSRHHRRGCHASGSTVRTAWTRRTGTVSATLPSKPRCTWIPSGASDTVKLYWPLKRRQMPVASPTR